MLHFRSERERERWGKGMVKSARHHGHCSCATGEKALCTSRANISLFPGATTDLE